MTIIQWEDLCTAEAALFPQGSAISIGGFDGPHSGHALIFSKVLAAAAGKHIPAGIITFVRSPRVQKAGQFYAGDVSTLRFRLNQIAGYGFSFVVLIDFSEDFAKMSGMVFFDILMRTICIKYLAVGSDFTCGYRHDTGVKDLERLASQKGFCFDSIEQLCLTKGIRISSSAIRNAVVNADFTLAKEFLGYPFSLDVLEMPRQYHDGILSIEKSSIRQILPKKGLYSAMVFTQQKQCMPAQIQISDFSLNIRLLYDIAVQSHTLSEEGIVLDSLVFTQKE
ncbi:MAG: FAD synthetase family protein [Treponema sp.]